MKGVRYTFGDRVTNWFAHGLIRLTLLLPYRARVPTAGWVIREIVAPIAGWRGRIRENLKLVRPDLTKAEVRRLCRDVPDNMGRTLIEVYSGREFARRCADLPLQGPGWEALDEARRTGRPVVVVSGHFGNYDAMRSAVNARGCNLGAIYRPFNNGFFDAHYLAAISVFGPIFARGRSGTAHMVRHLRQGAMVGIVGDQFVHGARDLTYFGVRAATSDAGARMAVKYDALLVPAYGVRRPDGMTFDVVIETPIPHGDPAEMSQKLNDSLEALTRKHMDQWMWTHRRWKAPGK